eukprot:scaffold597174_cov23-Prasinocladus_malaysianus.AAC.1
MSRNLSKRVEVAAPILDEKNKMQLHQVPPPFPDSYLPAYLVRLRAADEVRGELSAEIMRLPEAKKNKCMCPAVSLGR